MRLRSGLLLSAGLLAFPFGLATVAHAQAVQGLYIGAGAGYNLPMSPKMTGIGGGFSYGNPPAGGSLRLNQHGGFAGLASVGYGFGNGIRLEAEGDILQNNVSHLSGTAFPTSSNGNVRNWGLMANAYYDFNVGVPWVTPYLGVGAGYQWTHFIMSAAFRLAVHSPTAPTTRAATSPGRVSSVRRSRSATCPMSASTCRACS